MFVIMSASRADLHPVLNLARLAELMRTFEDAGIKPTLCEGSWQGIKEESIKIDLPGHAWPVGVLACMVQARKYNQAAILVVYDDERAGLIDPLIGKMTDVGVWTKVDGKPAGDYTRIGDDYYVCTPTV